MENTDGKGEAINGKKYTFKYKMVENYSTVTDLSERVKFDSPKQILKFTITVSSSQLNRYRYSKQKRIVTEPMISSIKLIMV